MKFFDSKCYELAQCFLEEDDLDTEENRNALAAQIQQTIEDFIEDKIEARKNDKTD